MSEQLLTIGLGAEALPIAFTVAEAPPDPIMALDPNAGVTAVAPADVRVDLAGSGRHPIDSIVDQAPGVTRTFALASGVAAELVPEPRAFRPDGPNTTAPLSASGVVLSGKTTWTIALPITLPSGQGTASVFHCEEDPITGAHLDLGFDATDQPIFRVTQADGTGEVTLTCTSDTLNGRASVASMATSLVDTGTRTRVELTLDPHPTLTDGASRFAQNDRVTFPGESGVLAGTWTVVEASTNFLAVVIDGGTAPGATPATVVRTGSVEWINGEPGATEFPGGGAPERVERGREVVLTVKRDGNTVSWYAGGFPIGSATSAGLPTGPASNTSTHLFRSLSGRVGTDAPNNCPIGRVEAYDVALSDALRLLVERRLSIGVNRTWQYGPAFFTIDLTGFAGVKRRDMPHTRCFVEFRDADTGDLVYPGTAVAGLEWASSYSTPSGWFVTQVLGDGTEATAKDYTASVTVLNPIHDEAGNEQADALIYDGVPITLTVEPWPGDGNTYHCSNSGTAGGTGSLADPMDSPVTALAVAGPLDRVLCERGSTFGGGWYYTGNGPLLLGSYGSLASPKPLLSSASPTDMVRWESNGTRVAGLKVACSATGALSWLVKPGTRGLVHDCDFEADSSTGEVGGFTIFRPTALGIDKCTFTNLNATAAYYPIVGEGLTLSAFTRLDTSGWSVDGNAHPLRIASGDRVQLAYYLGTATPNGVNALTPRHKLLWLNVHDCRSAAQLVVYAATSVQGWPAGSHAIRVHRVDAPQILLGNGAHLGVDHSYSRATGIVLAADATNGRGVTTRCRAHSNRSEDASGVWEQGGLYSWQVKPTTGDRRNLIDATGQFGGATFTAPGVVVLKSSGSRLVACLDSIVPGGEGRFELRFDRTPGGEIAGVGGPYFGIPLAPGTYDVGCVVTDEPASNTVFGPTTQATITG